MTETSTLTLTDFLLARIAEDEAVAREARPYEHLSTRDSCDLGWQKQNGYAITTATSGRVLAECEAKRRIIEAHPRYSCSHTRCGGSGAHCGTCGTPSVWPCATLTALALPYADHLDYRDAWRP